LDNSERSDQLLRGDEFRAADVADGSEAAYLPACLECITATPPADATGQLPQRNKGGSRRSRPEEMRAGGCPVASAGRADQRTNLSLHQHAE